MLKRKRQSSLRGIYIPSFFFLFRQYIRFVSDKLLQRYNCSIVNVVDTANGSAAELVNLLARDFSCFRDEHRFEGRNKPVRFLKRAQILVADLWACFEGESYGEFYDIDKITMFADYRIPQILITFGALYCSPPVAAAIRDKKMFKSGGRWEMQLRGMCAFLVSQSKGNFFKV